MKYLLKFIFPFQQKVGNGVSLTQGSLPTLLCAGYNVKLTMIVLNQIYFNYDSITLFGHTNGHKDHTITMKKYMYLYASHKMLSYTFIMSNAILYLPLYNHYFYRGLTKYTQVCVLLMWCAVWS